MVLFMINIAPRTWTSPQKLFLKFSSSNAAKISFGFGVNGYKLNVLHDRYPHTPLMIVENGFGAFDKVEDFAS